MIPTIDMGLGSPRFAQWHASYRERGERIKTDVAATIFDSMERHHLHAGAVRRDLRAARASLEHRFCLLLYASGSDEALVEGLLAGDIEGDDDADVHAALAT